jgi:hypothetical protein
VCAQETSAWALGAVFEHVHGSEPNGSAPIITKDSLPSLLAVLVESLKDEPRVAYYVCDAIRLLALGYQDQEGAWVAPAGREEGGWGSVPRRVLAGVSCPVQLDGVEALR